MRVPTIFLAVVGAIGMAGTATGSVPGVITVASRVAASASTGIATLDEIPPTTENPPSEYQREEGFGRSWLDVDGNHCDTRNDILGLQLTDVEYVPMDEAPSRCRRATVQSGILDDPYTGRRIEFTRDQPNAVQIDHLVPLSWAWRNGAWRLTQEERIAFANDPNNLLAVDGPTNQGKGDKGPSQWLPANEGFQCEYSERFTDVVFSYDLSLPDDDRAALTSLLTDCASGVVSGVDPSQSERGGLSDEELMEEIIGGVILVVAVIAVVVRYVSRRRSQSDKRRNGSGEGKSRR